MRKIVKIVLITLSIPFTTVVLFKWYYWWLSVSNNLNKHQESYTKLVLLLPDNKAYGTDSCMLQENREICNIMNELNLKSVWNFSEKIYLIEKRSWWSGISRVYLYRKNGWEWYQKDLEEINFQVIDKNWATYTQKPFL